MRIRRLALVILGILTFALSGCFGPLERPVADFTWCPNGYSGDLDYQFTSISVTVPGHIGIEHLPLPAGYSLESDFDTQYGEPCPHQ